MKNDGGPAFPHETVVYDDPEDRASGNYDGMMLRDYFAAKAMQGMLADPNVTDIEVFLEIGIKQAYAIADAMLAERAK